MSAGNAQQPILNKKPTPRTVVNRSSTLGRLVGYRAALGTAWYQFPDPDGHQDVLYVEPAPALVVNQEKVILVSILTAVLVAGILPGVLLYSQSSPSHLWLLAGFTLFSVALFALPAWVFCVCHKVGMPSAIVIEDLGGEIVARLAHRPEWCSLDSLTPQLSIGPLRFRSVFHRTIGVESLPKHLQGCSVAVWLRLESQSGFRWLMIQACESNRQAEKAVVEWAMAFRLESATAFGESETPESLILRKAR